MGYGKKDTKIVTIENPNLTELESQLAQKANQEDVVALQNNKRDKATKITDEDLDISSDANKIKLINLADEVQQALTGNAPALSVIPSKSVTLEKLGFTKLLSKNMFNKATATQGKKINRTTGVLEDNVNYYTSDFIEVDINTNYVINYAYNGAYFDANFNYMSGFQPTTEGTTYAFTTPSNVKYLRFSVYYSVLDTTQMEKGSVKTSYEEYSALIDSRVIEGFSDLKENANKVTETLDEILTYKTIAIDTGTFTTHRDSDSSFTGWAIPFLKSNFDEDITYMSWYISIGTNTNVPIVFELLDDAGALIRTIDNITIPSSGKVELKCDIKLNELTDTFYIGVRTIKEDVILMLGNANGTYSFPTSIKYTSSDYPGVWRNSSISSLGVTDIKLGTGLTAKTTGNSTEAVLNKVKLNLPSKYELVVGDTFELFYKGIILAKNPYNYNIELTCSKGSAYSKRFIYTPNINDVGTHVLNVSIYNDNEVLLDSKNVDLIVRPKATNPTSIKNVLNIGDSLTEYGTWVNEVHNRLVTQDGLSNVKFIGSRVINSGIGFEGYGGWSYETYLSDKRNGSRVWITTTHDKDESDQHSIYKDSNNTQWKLETIESGRLKLIRTSGTGTLSTSGTLTWVSGGTHTSDIVYTAVELESGNPFWNEISGEVDFANYASEIGVTSIDYVNILLGWNSIYKTEETIKNNIRTFIDKIIVAFPSAKITLIGLQVPSIDGLGENYGTDWKYYDTLKYVFNLDKWNKEVASEYSNVDAVNLSGQFDSENNIRTGTRPVNVRSSKTETYGSNGVHPADPDGYYQIADAVYRNMTHKI